MFIAGEGLLMSLVGGLLGAGLAWLIVNGDTLAVSGGFIPPFGVTRPQCRSIGVALSALIGVLAGAHPGDDGVAAEDCGRAAAGGVSAWD